MMMPGVGGDGVPLSPVVLSSSSDDDDDDELELSASDDSQFSDDDEAAALRPRQQRGTIDDLIARIQRDRQQAASNGWAANYSGAGGQRRPGPDGSRPQDWGVMHGADGVPGKRRAGNRVVVSRAFPSWRRFHFG
jgi:hypothetical protein